MKQNATGNFYIHDRKGGAQGGSRMAGHMTFYIFFIYSATGMNKIIARKNILVLSLSLFQSILIEQKI